MARKAKGPGYTPPSGKSPIFKNMGSSPAKGKLDDLIKNFGVELKRNRKDIGGESKGVKQKDKPGGFGSLTDKDKDGMSDFIQAPKKAPKGKETVSTKSKSKSKSKSSKPDWTKAPKVGTQARIDWYKKHNLALDDTTKLKEERFKWNVDSVDISEHGDAWREVFDKDQDGINDQAQGTTNYNPRREDFDWDGTIKEMHDRRFRKFEKLADGSAFNKKSPSKKRGYKMKRKK